MINKQHIKTQQFKAVLPIKKCWYGKDNNQENLIQTQISNNHQASYSYLNMTKQIIRSKRVTFVKTQCRNSPTSIFQSQIINISSLLLIKSFYFQNLYNIFMKIILSLILLIAVASAFQIRIEQAERVGYPFFPCNPSNILFTSLTLDKTPILNINLTATIVGKAKKDLALNHAYIIIARNGTYNTIQQDYNVTYKIGDITNFTFTYQIPQYQPKGGYSAALQLTNIDNHNERCMIFTYTL